MKTIKETIVSALKIITFMIISGIAIYALINSSKFNKAKKYERIEKIKTAKISDGRIRTTNLCLDYKSVQYRKIIVSTYFSPPLQWKRTPENDYKCESIGTDIKKLIELNIVNRYNVCLENSTHQFLSTSYKYYPIHVVDLEEPCVDSSDNSE